MFEKEEGEIDEIDMSDRLSGSNICLTELTKKLEEKNIIIKSLIKEKEKILEQKEKVLGETQKTLSKKEEIIKNLQKLYCKNISMFIFIKTSKLLSQLSQFVPRREIKIYFLLQS